MATATKPGFRATRKGDRLTIHRVPIFVETEKRVTKKGDDGQPVTYTHQFGAEWIQQAVERAKLREAEGYLPPLHVQHHGGAREVKAAGHFRVLGTEQIQFDGQQRTAVMADLIFTKPEIAAEVKASRLPYRSVEIHKVDTPAFDSLALLDDEAPHCRLPMLEVGDEEEVAARSDFGGMTVFRTGERAEVRFAFDEKKPQAEKDDKPPMDGSDEAEKPEGKPPVDGKEGEEAPEAETPGVQALIESITAGTISVADFQAVVAAIKAKTGGEQTDPNQPTQGDEPAKAPAPGAAMHDHPTEGTHMTTEKKGATPEVKLAADTSAAVQMAALQGEVEGLKAKVAAQEAETKRKGEVASALQRLKDRPLGSDLESRLVKFHTDHGAAAFAAYVDSMEKAFGVLPAGGGADVRMAGEKVPEVAMKYAKDGTDAIDLAAKFASEWDQLHAVGCGISMTQERYVAINMEKAAAISGRK